MNGKRKSGVWGLGRLASAGAIMLLAALAGGVQAQGTPSGAIPPAPSLPPAVPGTGSGNFAPAGDGVVQAGCASCGGGGLLGIAAPEMGGIGGCASCGGCGSGGCNGQRHCDCCCDGENIVARLFCGFYQCVCCPDPCYEGHWNALADAAFWQDAPRPVTQMNLTYDHVWSYPFADKAEFLFARGDGNGKGPKLGAGPNQNVSYQDFRLYQEVAIDRFSLSIDLPYLEVQPDNTTGASGFGDMIIGTKSMLLDCELMQFSFGFKTFIPTGNFLNGLGTGHTSLEPALIMALKITPDTYLQTELAYRFPLGGDQTFQGPVLHYHVSLNQLLWHCGHDIKLVGVAELNGYELLGGAYTTGLVAADGTPIIGSAKDIGDILNIGPGLRLVVCDKIDFGIGSAFNFTSSSMGDEWLKVQFRWRF